MLQRGVVWCSVVQCDAAWYSVVQCVAVWYSVLRCGTVWYNVLQRASFIADAAKVPVHVPECVFWVVQYQQREGGRERGRERGRKGREQSGE